jgi:ribonucleoside-diphosphate reductase beta chain
MLCLERIQFMASFAITFAIADTGMFMPIGKAVQKIAQEELEVHAEAGILILKNELSTEFGRESFERVKLTCSMLIAEVIESEFNWIDYAFSEGRELVGVNKDNMKNAVLYFAKSVYSVLGITDLCTYKLPDRNPIKYIENWLNIGKIQPSPQEESAAMYKLNIMTRTDEGKVYDTDF